MEKICVGWHEESYTNIWRKKYNWSILCISRKPVHTIPEVYFEKVGKSQKFQKVIAYFVEKCHPNFEEIFKKPWKSSNTLEPKQLAVKLNKQWVHATIRAGQLTEIVYKELTISAFQVSPGGSTAIMIYQ